MMTIKNVTYGLMFGTFLITCMIGFLAPVIWPEMYEHLYFPAYGWQPLVQHHVEFCDIQLLLEQPDCSEDQIFIS